jgi:hypothetical protein
MRDDELYVAIENGYMDLIRGTNMFSSFGNIRARLRCLLSDADGRFEEILKDSDDTGDMGGLEEFRPSEDVEP